MSVDMRIKRTKKSDRKATRRLRRFAVVVVGALLIGFFKELGGWLAQWVVEWLM